jgi:hypothetical protein
MPGGSPPTRIIAFRGRSTVVRTRQTLLCFVLGACLVLAAGMALCTWSLNEDLFMALAAGRDVVQGWMGKPDRWSFTTGGAVWINQGWLSGYLFYVAFQEFGEWGPILIKGMILAGILVPLFLRCGRLRASPEASLLALTAGTLAVAPHMAIRAENFAVLWFVLLSTILTAPERRGAMRYVLALGIVALWANCHGSFLIGFGLIALKTMRMALATWVESLPASRSDDSASGEAGGAATHATTAASPKFPRREPLWWFLTWLLTFPIMAWANPFGPVNLMLPFRQVGSELWTEEVFFWSPLVKLESTGEWSLYLGGNSIPFLCFLGLVVLLAFGSWAMRSNGAARLKDWLSRSEPDQGDLATEVAIAVCMTVLTIRYGRTIVFTVPALTPLCALLMQTFGEGMSRRIAESEDLHRAGGLLAILAALGLFGMMVWLFLVQVAIPFLPGNPVAPSASLGKTLLGPLATETAGLTAFLERNRIRLRMLATWQTANAVLLEVPGTQVFLDLRAQSIYSDAIKRDYNAMVRADPQNPASATKALALLDYYGVSAVAFQKSLAETLDFPNILADSRKWVPLYVDSYGVFLVRTESPLLKRFRQTGRLDNLWYPDRQSRLLSECQLRLALWGTVPPDRLAELKKVAAEHPAEIMYRTIALADRLPDGCLSRDARAFLSAELTRLSGESFLRADGVQSILGSLWEILIVMERDQEMCSRSSASPDFEKSKDRILEAIAETRQRYTPRLWVQ